MNRICSLRVARELARGVPRARRTASKLAGYTRNRTPSAFTLFEMLLATMLATILMGGILAMSAALARDQKRLSAHIESSTEGVIELLRFDLSNARSMSQSPDGLTLVLVGHGALDRRMLTPTNRLVRVVYRVDPQRGGVLARQQEFLDEPVRPQRWSELVATGVARIDLVATSNDSQPIAEPLVSASLLGAQRMGDVRVAPQQIASMTVPTRVRIHIASASAPVDQEIWVR